MILLRSLASVLVISGMAVSMDMVFGQDYPTKPIRLITTEPGGSGDAIARLIAQAISGPLNQQVIVDNRSAVLGIEAVAKAAPDGYTLLTPGAAMWIGPLL